MVDDGSGTRAAHGDEFLLQAVGGQAALQLSPQHKDLLLDGDGVEAVVLLPQWVHAARQAALGVSNHLGEAVGVFIEPGDGNRKGLYVLAQHGLVECSWFISMKGPHSLSVYPHYETRTNNFPILNIFGINSQKLN